ncbi:glycosyltransferase family 4 protein [Thiothrix fructosivorans]|jgi:glycosyltransferase involved in cell wall biosynthesis|uniref:Glycosyltransferase family 4 protein n=1 Tax=Thiothrix fructosivorans TaxID=111770 RepID=A0A8B0SMW6_9GAMM|nr:glycosyltransferase family 1 protein [Thiothrix fructosivorans]MBO0612024.1 glycosyltransferase family 4 protein [Thiothrix fructosivorans]QTX12475.1 glycosyltransferase family 4 protein [Thiothrix fructosivorans]
MHKKIGILTFYPMHGGGIFQYIQSMVDALSVDKTNTYIIFADINDDRFDGYGLEVRKLTPSNRSTLNQTLIFSQLLLGMRESFFLRDDEKQAYADIDLFISPATSVYPHLFLKKPFVFTLHDMQEKYYPHAFTWTERFKRELRNRALTKSAKAVICESNYVRNDIMNFLGANSDKIAVIQSPPPDFLLRYEAKPDNFAAVRQKYGLPERYIFYPAQCWFHKNHIQLVEAFNRIVTETNEDVFLILSGSQQDNYPKLMAKIQELGLEYRIKHLGYIDYEDIPYLYKMARMLVMPTLFESVSIPIYEAFALGVPVCCSNVVALPEQVGDAALIFNPNDPIDMSQKMLQLLRDEALAAELAVRGQQRVSSFDHKGYSTNILSVLEK